MEKKAKAILFKTHAINPSTAPEFTAEINELLANGWDILTSFPMGLDTGGGVSGGGSVMMAVTLVQYEYFQLQPAPVPNAD